MTKKRIYYSGFIILLLIGFFYGYSKYNHYFPSTDDAYVQANIVNIAAQVTGPVQAIFVADHQLVKKNQLLFTIDPKPFQIALQQAEANLLEAKAALDTQQKNTARILELVSKGQMTKADGDNADGQLNQLTAAYEAAQAQLSQAQLNLTYTNVISPADGYLTNFVLRKGQIIEANNPLFALIENNQWWVDANFKETDLERIQIGKTAKIKVDIYPSIAFKGIVQGVSAGSGAAFAILPPENATGNWVKVTQRFPVRINIINPDPNYPLRVGASCSVTVDTRNETH